MQTTGHRAAIAGKSTRRKRKAGGNLLEAVLRRSAPLSAEQEGVDESTSYDLTNFCEGTPLKKRAGMTAPPNTPLCLENGLQDNLETENFVKEIHSRLGFPSSPASRDTRSPKVAKSPHPAQGWCEGREAACQLM